MSDSEMVPTTFVLEAKVDISFDANDVIKDLKMIQIIQLIKEMDEEIGHWEFSELMARHFNSQQALVKQHAPFIHAMSDDELAAELNILDSADIEGDHD